MKLSVESAKAQYDILADYYDFELDNGKALNGSNYAELVDTFADRIQTLIQKGILEVESKDGRAYVIHHLKREYSKPIGKQLVYKPLTGKIKVDLKKARNEEKSLLVMARMAGVSTTDLEVLDSPDFTVIDDVLGPYFLLL